MAGKDIDDLPKNAANYTALTPLWFLERAALVHPNRASLVHGSRRYTWQDTYLRCRRLASALSRCSIGLGCTVNLFPYLCSLCYHFYNRYLSLPIPCLVPEKTVESQRKGMKKSCLRQTEKEKYVLKFCGLTHL